MPRIAGFLYINGLGGEYPRASEWREFSKLENGGIKAAHAHVNWRNETFDGITNRLEEQVLELLKLGDMAIGGFSAGGSEAINLYHRLKNVPGLSATNIAGRLRRGGFRLEHPHHLKYAAHLGTPKASQAFYDSVIHCEDNVLPALTEQDKERLRVLKPRRDIVVPPSTVEIPGVETITLDVFAHPRARVRGLQLLTDHLLKTT